MAYRVILVVHIVAIISWMAGILYLYRLFVNHRDQGFKNLTIHDLLLGMEKRLYRTITVPAMAVAILTGLTMAILAPVVWGAGWFQVKLTMVLFLIGATVMGRGYIERFTAMDESLPPGRTFRFLNEVPTLLMIIIVAMVILKPG